jgi:hypothetical protein
MYTLLVLLVVLNQYFFLRIFRSSRSTQNNAGTWFWYGATALLGIFTHYFFLLTLLSQLIFYAFYRRFFPRKSLQRFALIGTLLLGAFAPWVWYVLSLGLAGNQSPLLAAPSVINLFNSFSQFLFGFQGDHLNTFFLSLWPITLVLGFLALRRGVRVTPESAFFLITVFVSFAVAFFVSFVIPIFESRYLIITIPALYLLLLSLFTNYTGKAQQLAPYALAAVMVVGLCIEILNPSAPVKENYRTATEYLNTHATGQDVIVLSAPFTFYPVDYYYRGAAPIETLPRWDRYAYGPIPPFEEDRLPQEVEDISGSYQRLFLLLSYDQGYEQAIKEFFDTNYQRLDAQEFSPGLHLYVYQLRYDTSLSRLGEVNARLP